MYSQVNHTAMSKEPNKNYCNECDLEVQPNRKCTCDFRKPSGGFYQQDPTNNKEWEKKYPFEPYEVLYKKCKTNWEKKLLKWYLEDFRTSGEFEQLRSIFSQELSTAKKEAEQFKKEAEDLYQINQGIPKMLEQASQQAKAEILEKVEKYETVNAMALAVKNDVIKIIKE